VTLAWRSRYGNWLTLGGARDLVGFNALFGGVWRLPACLRGTRNTCCQFACSECMIVSGIIVSEEEEVGAVHDEHYVHALRVCGSFGPTSGSSSRAR
jgi:hypothetical protein